MEPQRTAGGIAMTDSFDTPTHDFSTDTLSDGPQDVATATLETPVQAPNPFAQLGLAPELLSAIADLGYTQPTLVQTKTIPLALPAAGNAEQAQRKFIDLMVSSQTGSGKTAAFLIPVI